jgi:hypothetical protein
MRIFTPLGSEGFELCHPVNTDDFETLNVLIDGTPRTVDWSPPPMHIVRDDRGKALVESDSPWLGSHALIFRPTAVSPLRDLLLHNGEILPLPCGSESLSLFNPKVLNNALDLNASTVLRFGSGRIMRVTKHAFDKLVVAGVDAFKIPDLRVSPTFVSERLVSAWTSAGLRGLDFRLAWDG